MSKSIILALVLSAALVAQDKKPSAPAVASTHAVPLAKADIDSLKQTANQMAKLKAQFDEADLARYRAADALQKANRQWEETFAAVQSHCHGSIDLATLTCKVAPEPPKK